MSPELAKAIAWAINPEGPPPPFSGPPNDLVCHGADFFGIIQRRCDRENAARDAAWELERQQYKQFIEAGLANKRRNA